MKNVTLNSLWHLHNATVRLSLSLSLSLSLLSLSLSFTSIFSLNFEPVERFILQKDQAERMKLVYELTANLSLAHNLSWKWSSLLQRMIWRGICWFTDWWFTVLQRILWSWSYILQLLINSSAFFMTFFSHPCHVLLRWRFSLLANLNTWCPLL